MYRPRFNGISGLKSCMIVGFLLWIPSRFCTRNSIISVWKLIRFKSFRTSSGHHCGAIGQGLLHHCGAYHRDYCMILGLCLDILALLVNELKVLVNELKV